MNTPNSTQTANTAAAESFAFAQPVTLQSPHTHKIAAELSTIELAQLLAERLAITPDEWHRLKANRKARAAEQAAIALVYLLNDRSDEALARYQQTVGWLDRSITAPPCPSHGK